MPDPTQESSNVEDFDFEENLNASNKENVNETEEVQTLESADFEKNIQTTLDIKDVDISLDAPTKKVTEAQDAEIEAYDGQVSKSEAYDVNTDIDKLIEAEQSFTDDVTRAIGGGIYKGALTFTENVGYLIDVQQWFGYSNSFEEGYTNMLSEWASEEKARYSEYNPIYGDDAFSATMNGLQGLIDSTVGFAGIGAGAGQFVSKGAFLLNKLLKAGHITEAAIARIGTAAATNYAESTMMAAEMHKNIMDKAIKNKVNYEDAVKIANKEAKDFMWQNKINVATDMFTLRSMSKGKGIISGAMDKSKKAIINEGLKDAGGEAFEEVSAGFLQKDNERDAELQMNVIVADESSYIGRAFEYATSEEGLTEAVMGAIGGPFQKVTLDALNKGINKAKKAIGEKTGKYAPVNDPGEFTEEKPVFNLTPSKPAGKRPLDPVERYLKTAINTTREQAESYVSKEDWAAYEKEKNEWLKNSVDDNTYEKEKEKFDKELKLYEQRKAGHALEKEKYKEYTYQSKLGTKGQAKLDVQEFLKNDHDLRRKYNKALIDGDKSTQVDIENQRFEGLFMRYAENGMTEGLEEQLKEIKEDENSTSEQKVFADNQLKKMDQYKTDYMKEYNTHGRKKGEQLFRLKQRIASTNGAITDLNSEIDKSGLELAKEIREVQGKLISPLQTEKLALQAYQESLEGFESKLSLNDKAVIKSDLEKKKNELEQKIKKLDNEIKESNTIEVDVKNLNSYDAFQNKSQQKADAWITQLGYKKSYDYQSSPQFAKDLQFNNFNYLKDRIENNTFDEEDLAQNIAMVTQLDISKKQKDKILKSLDAVALEIEEKEKEEKASYDDLIRRKDNYENLQESVRQNSSASWKELLERQRSNTSKEDEKIKIAENRYKESQKKVDDVIESDFKEYPKLPGTGDFFVDRVSLTDSYEKQANRDYESLKAARQDKVNSIEQNNKRIKELKDQIENNKQQTKRLNTLREAVTTRLSSFENFPTSDTYDYNSQKYLEKLNQSILEEETRKTAEFNNQGPSNKAGTPTTEYGDNASPVPPPGFGAGERGGQVKGKPKPSGIINDIENNNGKNVKENAKKGFDWRNAEPDWMDGNPISNEAPEYDSNNTPPPVNEEFGGGRPLDNTGQPPMPDDNFDPNQDDNNPPEYQGKIDVDDVDVKFIEEQNQPEYDPNNAPPTFSQVIENSRKRSGKQNNRPYQPPGMDDAPPTKNPFNNKNKQRKGKQADGTPEVTDLSKMEVKDYSEPGDNPPVDDSPLSTDQLEAGVQVIRDLKDDDSETLAAATSHLASTKKSKDGIHIGEIASADFDDPDYIPPVKKEFNERESKINSDWEWSFSYQSTSSNFKGAQANESGLVDWLETTTNLDKTGFTVRYEIDKRDLESDWISTKAFAAAKEALNVYNSGGKLSDVNIANLPIRTVVYKDGKKLTFSNKEVYGWMKTSNYNFIDKEGEKGEAVLKARKAIVSAANKKGFYETKINKIGSGKLLSDNERRDPRGKLPYIKLLISNGENLIDGDKEVDEDFDIGGTRGFVFLKTTDPNGRPFPLKMNSRRIDADENRAILNILLNYAKGAKPNDQVNIKDISGITNEEALSLLVFEGKKSLNNEYPLHADYETNTLMYGGKSVPFSKMNDPIVQKDISDTISKMWRTTNARMLNKKMSSSLNSSDLNWFGKKIKTEELNYNDFLFNDEALSTNAQFPSDRLFINPHVITDRPEEWTVNMPGQEPKRLSIKPKPNTSNTVKDVVQEKNQVYINSQEKIAALFPDKLEVSSVKTLVPIKPESISEEYQEVLDALKNKTKYEGSIITNAEKENLQKAYDEGKIRNKADVFARTQPESAAIIKERDEALAKLDAKKQSVETNTTTDTGTKTNPALEGVSATDLSNLNDEQYKELVETGYTQYLDNNGEAVEVTYEKPTKNTSIEKTKKEIKTKSQKNTPSKIKKTPASDVEKTYTIDGVDITYNTETGAFTLKNGKEVTDENTKDKILIKHGIRTENIKIHKVTKTTKKGNEKVITYYVLPKYRLLEAKSKFIAYNRIISVSESIGNKPPIIKEVYKDVYSKKRKTILDTATPFKQKKSNVAPKKKNSNTPPNTPSNTVPNRNTSGDDFNPGSSPFANNGAPTKQQVDDFGPEGPPTGNQKPVTNFTLNSYIDDVKKEYGDDSTLSDAESGMSGQDIVEIQILQNAQEALFPSPEDVESEEEYDEYVKDVKASQKYKELQEKIDSYSKSKPTTDTATQPTVPSPAFEGNISQDMFGENDVMVFGANSAGGHGQGVAALAYANTTENYRKWNPDLVADIENKEVGDFAIAGETGLSVGNKGTGYGLVTKNASVQNGKLKIGKPLDYVELGTQIRELYNTAKENPNKRFIIPYNSDVNLNKSNLNQLANAFGGAGIIPPNIFFGDKMLAEIKRIKGTEVFEQASEVESVETTTTQPTILSPADAIITMDAMPEGWINPKSKLHKLFVKYGLTDIAERRSGILNDYKGTATPENNKALDKWLADRGLSGYQKGNAIMTKINSLIEKRVPTFGGKLVEGKFFGSDIKEFLKKQENIDKLAALTNDAVKFHKLNMDAIGGDENIVKEYVAVKQKLEKAVVEVVKDEFGIQLNIVRGLLFAGDKYLDAGTTTTTTTTTDTTTTNTAPQSNELPISNKRTVKVLELVNDGYRLQVLHKGSKYVVDLYPDGERILPQIIEDNLATSIKFNNPAVVFSKKDVAKIFSKAPISKEMKEDAENRKRFGSDVVDGKPLQQGDSDTKWDEILLETGQIEPRAEQSYEEYSEEEPLDYERYTEDYNERREAYLGYLKGSKETPPVKNTKKVSATDAVAARMYNSQKTEQTTKDVANKKTNNTEIVNLKKVLTPVGFKQVDKTEGSGEIFILKSEDYPFGGGSMEVEYNKTENKYIVRYDNGTEEDFGGKYDAANIIKKIKEISKIINASNEKIEKLNNRPKVGASSIPERSNRKTNSKSSSEKLNLTGDNVQYSELKVAKKRVDAQKEAAELARLLPNVPVNIVNGLIGMTNGGVAEGQFYNGVVTISDLGNEGVAYHEGFHAVVDGYLTFKERQNLFDEARKRFGKNKTDLQVEEILAEEFREYMLSNRNRKTPSTFKWLYDMLADLVNLFKGKNRRLFSKIRRGRFDYSPTFSKRNEILYSSSELKGRPSQLLIREAVDAITYRVVNYAGVRTMDDSKENYDNLDDVFIDVKDSLIDDMIKANEENNEEVLTNLGYVLNSDEELDNWDAFVARAKDELSAYNLTARKDDTTTNEDNQDVKNELNIKPALLYSGKNNANNNTKLMVAMLKDPNAKSEIFGSGFEKLANFDTSWTLLENSLSGIVSKSETRQMMTDAVDLLATDHPEFNELLSQLKADDSIVPEYKKTQFFKAFSKQSVLYNATIIEENKGDYTVKIGNADTQSIANVLMENWKEEFKQGFGSDGNLNNKDSLWNTVKRYRKLKTYSFDIVKNKNNLPPNSYRLLAGIFTDVGIGVSPSAIKSFVSSTYGRTEASKFKNAVNRIEFMFLDSKNNSSISLESMLKNNEYVEESNFITDHNSILKTLGLNEAYSKKETLENMVMGPDGNMYWTKSLNNNVTKTVALWKQNPGEMNGLWQSVYHNKSRWLNNFMASDNIDNFSPSDLESERKKRIEKLSVEVFLVNRIDDGVDKGSSYSKLNKFDANIDSINKTLNGVRNPSKLGSVFSPLTLADKSSFYMFSGIPVETFGVTEKKSKNKEYDKAINVMLGYFEAEAERIATSIDEESNISNINQYSKASKEMFWFPELSIGTKLANKYKMYDNDGKVKLDSSKVMGKVRTHIEQSIKNRIKEYKDSLIQKGIVIKNEDNQYQIKGIDQSILNYYKRNTSKKENVIDNLLSDYVLNSMVSNIEFTMLFVGDPAFYKDLSKRTPSTIATGDDLIPIKGEPKNFTVSVVKDVILDSTLYDEYVEVFKEKGFNNPEESLSAYKGMEIGDGQAYIRPSRFRSIMRQSGKWMPSHQEAYEKLISKDPEVLASLKPSDLAIMQPLKGMHFELRKGLDKIPIPTYLKYSQAVLWPSLVKGTMNEKLLNQMEEDEVDELVFESAIKVGATNISNLDNVFNGLSKKGHFQTFELQNFYWKLQQDLTAKYEDKEKALLGSQAKKNIKANIMGRKFDVPGFAEKVTGKKLAELIDNVESELSDIGKKEFDNKYGIVNGKITNLEPIYRHLEEKFKKDRVDNNVLGQIKQKVDLDLVFQYKEKIEQEMYAELNKATVKLTHPGGSFIQISGAGFTGLKKFSKSEIDLNGIIPLQDIDSLRGPRKGPDGTIAADIMLPFKAVRDIPNYEKMSSEELKNALGDTLTDLVGYRIPNQGMSSIDLLNVVGILPQSAGDSMIVYDEITGKTGSDFDIDKMYVMMHNTVFNPRTGKLEKLNDTNISFMPNAKEDFLSFQKKILQNKRMDLWGAVLKSKDTFVDLVTPIDSKWLKKDADFLQLLFTPADHDQFLEFSKISSMKKFIKLKGKEKNELAFEFYKTKKMNSLQYASPLEQMDIKDRNMAGQLGIGITANHLVHHVQMQQIEYAKTFNEDGDSITNVMSAWLNAFVDIAKDPYISQINNNSFTSNTVFYLLRQGYSPVFVNRLMSQPIIKAYTENNFKQQSKILKPEYRKPGNSYTSYSFESLSKANNPGELQIDNSSVKISAVNNTVGTVNPINQTIQENGLVKFFPSKKKKMQLSKGEFAKEKMFTIEQLENGMLENDPKFQAEILMYFEGVRGMATDFNKMVRATKFDTDGAGSSNVENYTTQKLTDIVLNSVNGITHGKILRESFIGSMMRNSHRAATDMFGDLFMSGSKSAKANLDAINLMIGKDATDLEINKTIVKEYYNYVYSSGFKNLNINEMFYGNKTMAHKVRMMKKKYPKNKFLSTLGTNISTDENPSFVTFPSSKKKNKSQIDDLWSSWEELMESEDYFTNNKTGTTYKTSQFARDLVSYAFAGSGFNKNINSFYDLIPHTFMNGDLGDVSFNKTIMETKKDLKTDLYSDTFVDQFFRHNWEDSTIVPSYSLKANNKIFKTVKGYPKGKAFVINKSDLPTKMNLGTKKNPIAREYVRLKFSGDLSKVPGLYQAVGDNTGDIYYQRVPVLGYYNKGNTIREYDYDNDVKGDVQLLDVPNISLELDLVSPESIIDSAEELKQEVEFLKVKDFRYLENPSSINPEADFEVFKTGDDTYFKAEEYKNPNGETKFRVISVKEEKDGTKKTRGVVREFNSKDEALDSAIAVIESMSTTDLLLSLSSEC